MGGPRRTRWEMIALKSIEPFCVFVISMFKGFSGSSVPDIASLVQMWKPRVIHGSFGMTQYLQDPRSHKSRGPLELPPAASGPEGRSEWNQTESFWRGVEVESVGGGESGLTLRAPLLMHTDGKN